MIEGDSSSKKRDERRSPGERDQQQQVPSVAGTLSKPTTKSPSDVRCSDVVEDDTPDRRQTPAGRLFSFRWEERLRLSLNAAKKSVGTSLTDDWGRLWPCNNGTADEFV